MSYAAAKLGSAVLVRSFIPTWLSHDRIARQVADLQEAGRRLAVLIDIAHHPRETCSSTELDPLT